MREKCDIFLSDSRFPDWRWLFPVPFLNLQIAWFNFFKDLNIIPLYKCTICFFSSHHSMDIEAVFISWILWRWQQCVIASSGSMANGGIGRSISRFLRNFERMSQFCWNVWPFMGWPSSRTVLSLKSILKTKWIWWGW